MTKNRVAMVMLLNRALNLFIGFLTISVLLSLNNAELVSKYYFFTSIFAIQQVMEAGSSDLLTSRISGMKKMQKTFTEAVNYSLISLTFFVLLSLILVTISYVSELVNIDDIYVLLTASLAIPINIFFYQLCGSLDGLGFIGYTTNFKFLIKSVTLALPILLYYGFGMNSWIYFFTFQIVVISLIVIFYFRSLILNHYQIGRFSLPIDIVNNQVKLFISYVLGFAQFRGIYLLIYNYSDPLVSANMGIGMSILTSISGVVFIYFRRELPNISEKKIYKNRLLTLKKSFVLIGFFISFVFLLYLLTISLKNYLSIANKLNLILSEDYFWLYLIYFTVQTLIGAIAYIYRSSGRENLLTWSILGTLLVSVVYSLVIFYSLSIIKMLLVLIVQGIMMLVILELIYGNKFRDTNTQQA